jgi:hypothetical protein
MCFCTGRRACRRWCRRRCPHSVGPQLRHGNAVRRLSSVWCINDVLWWTTTGLAKPVNVSGLVDPVLIIINHVRRRSLRVLARCTLHVPAGQGKSPVAMI